MHISHPNDSKFNHSNAESELIDAIKIDMPTGYLLRELMTMYIIATLIPSFYVIASFIPFFS